MIKPADKFSDSPSSIGINRMPVEQDVLESASPEVTQPPRVVRGLKRICYLAGASVFFTLGILGALLPGLPATPFLLLTSYFLLRTSPKLHAKLMRSRWFGPILQDWQIKGGLRRHIKLKAILFVAVAVGLTIAFSGLSLWPKMMVGLLACIGISVIVKLPTAE
ncbi:YbaN family protein [Planctomycetaceae bacterium]|jgi:uncharacterized protein|nr:YbaN family protein [Planctomycetaceae bacterium]MDG2388527.1 YbaN family protein [Planctomycetaceae bacterium]